MIITIETLESGGYMVAANGKREFHEGGTLFKRIRELLQQDCDEWAKTTCDEWAKTTERETISAA